jgi:DNA-directed RNA polymerase specialized sigma24 family protein
MAVERVRSGTALKKGLPGGSSSGIELRKGAFPATHWSVVLVAGQKDTPQSAAALEELCRSYWYPLYAYARRRGYSPENAQDLTQEFFARLLAKQWLGMADPGRGRFRSFLLAGFNHFLANQHARDRCLKRGGGQPLLPFDPVEAERHYGALAAGSLSAEQIYERNWALQLLERTRTRLRKEYLDRQPSEPFERLEAFLPGEASPVSYAQAAAESHVAESTLRSKVHRLKRRYGELLREEIAHTVAGPAEIGGELRYLISVLGR